MASNDGNDEPTDDGTFWLYDLRVECVEMGGQPVANYEVGDYFEVHGGKIVFPPDQDGFSMYALASLLPLLPAKQRESQPNDWMTTDTRVADPDPNVGGIFEITRIDKRAFNHDDVSGEELSPE